MPRYPQPAYDESTDGEGAASPEGLSQNGQMIGIAVYGGLVLVGFFFGIVTGYESPTPPVVVVKKVKEPQQPEPPKPQPQITPEPKKVDPPAPPPEPKQVDPPTPPEPKKGPPTPEPKGTGMPDPATVAVSFEKNVKPILRTYCFNCHGGAGKPKGDVDLTSLAKILDPNNPPILKPGNPKGSAIFTTIDDMSMPPDGARPGKGELEVIKNWILGGAKP